MVYSFDWVDAFSDRPFAGNACVVVHGAEDISTEDRMRLVRETSLSECAYLVPSAKADFGARYYLAAREIPMAGHPTIATVASLLSRDLVQLVNGKASFNLEVGAGVLPIDVTTAPDGHLEITMTQLRPVFGNKHDPTDIASLYGLQGSDIVGTPQMVSTGSPFCIAVIKDKATLRRAALNTELLADYVAGERCDFFNTFLVCLNGETPAGDVCSRLLLPPPMPIEDPFTGSATGCMAAYIWANGLILSPWFVAQQGHWIGRPGTAQVDIIGPPDDISAVRVGGRGYVLMSGELRL
ncbi:MAG: PhzF family phenazine biosynthesis protein [Paracoccaceae bacterium]